MNFQIRVPMPIQWADMDALGHVNNTVYFTWFETARIALFLELGLKVGELGKVGPILATTTCNFRLPLAFPGDVECCAGISKIGNTSFTMAYAVLKDGELAADGSGVVVLLDYTTNSKVPIPDEMRAILERLQV